MKFSLIFLFTVGSVLSETCGPITDVNLLFVRGPQDVIEITPDKTADLLTSGFDAKKKTVVYCYGYTESFDSESVKYIVYAYLTRNDHNILILDWSKYSGGNYMLDSFPNALKVGQLYGELFVKMVQQGFDISKFHLVGHSLGAHVLGQAGRVAAALSQNSVRINRITGLDPAAPAFFPLNPYIYPLNKYDGNFVDIIHTNSKQFGASASTGHADFYPNGGAEQVGCPPFDYSNLLNIENFCSHVRSWIYFGESLMRPTTSKPFISIKCNSWDDFIKHRCLSKDRKNVLNYMGYYANPNYAGDFYLQTNDNQPFSRDSKGLSYKK